MRVCPNCGEENPERFRLCGFCGTKLVPDDAPQAARKLVTVVFCDLAGSTSMGERLDSESLRALMTRYFDEMRGVLESHGGVVEKYIGDAVMAVFGLPVVREDDAARAVAAAEGMRAALERLNDELEAGWGVRLTSRIGVNTGEVVSGDPTEGEHLVVGDAVNVAARLEQAAGGMEILIGPLTHRLTRETIEVEPVEPLDLKGKAERVPAYRLLGLADPDRAPAARAAPLVGRDSELRALLDERGRARVEQRCRLVTVLGEAGVGKSRLLAALADSLDADELLLRGRCLAYGRGITFWPLREAMRQAAAVSDDDTPEVAQEKLRQLAGPDAAGAVERVASAIGLSGAQFPVHEVFWGARKLLEAIAARRPLVLAFEDVHWAETTFLEFVEHLTDEAEGPLLLVSLARPEFLEMREGWGERAGGVRISLEPLREADVGRVVEQLLGEARVDEDVRARIAAASEGNPLFVEQLLEMMVEEGLLRRDGEVWVAAGDLSTVSMPPTIHALLAARLESLGAEEREVIGAASVVGQLFVQGAVEELVSERVRGDLPGLLEALIRRQLIRPEQADLSGERRYRFGHILIRDATYRGLLKSSRAVLHERFVAWADRVNQDRDRAVEYEEILGYHLEQAHRCLSELGPLDDHGRELGARAAARLSSAGARAFARGDMPAAANLLRRAVTLLPPESRDRLARLPDLAEVMMAIGEFAWAETFLDEAIETAESTGEDGLAASARLLRLRVRSHSAEPEDWTEQVVVEADRGLPVLEAGGDRVELARALRMVAWAHGTACRYGKAAAAAQRAMEQASLGEDERQRQHAASQYAIAALYGPTPVGEAIERCESIVAEAREDRRTQGLVMSLLSGLRGMQGDFAAARDLYTRARLMLEELGRSVVAASTSQQSCRVELLAGEPAAAERELRRDFEELSEMGERYFLSTAAGELARAVYAQGRYDEAEELTRVAEELSADDDLTSQALWRSVRGKTLARRGLAGEAEELARAAVGLLEGTDALILQADALEDLAEVLALTASDGARECLTEALGRLERKDDVVSAERVRSSLRALETAA
ncbi:MAG TPA: adenylate/guanylate cyclase domain-containing protein [Gaiellaceae bacterium]|nr:adenylate/guanylate cyclase domain-containing protein [Gaiellaceae bacterium]